MLGEIRLLVVLGEINFLELVGMSEITEGSVLVKMGVVLCEIVMDAVVGVVVVKLVVVVVPDVEED